MMEELPSTNTHLNNNDYDSDYPAFENSNNTNSVIINFESKQLSSLPTTSSGGGGGSKKLPQKNTNNTETKVVKFPAKNVPKNSDKFLNELKTKVSQLNSQLIVTKLPCGGYNILVKSTKDKINEVVALVERELEPKITKKLKLESGKYAMLTSKNFEITNEILNDIKKNITITTQQPNTLILTGVACDINCGVQLITKYIEKITVTEKIILDDIAQKYHPFIRGAFNCNISRIMTECNNCVVIDVPLPNSNNRCITITGPEEYRLKAKKELLNIYESVRKHSTVRTFKISTTLHSNIRRACGIDKILKETNVAVSLPYEAQKSDSVIFVGASKDIPNAFQLALARARVYNYHEIVCKPWVFKILRQKPSFSFGEVKNSYPNVWISYLQSKECIVLDGPSDDVDEIDKFYNEEIDNIMKNMTFKSIKIPTTYLPYIRTNGYYVIEKISQATETKIDITDDNNNTTKSTTAAALPTTYDSTTTTTTSTTSNDRLVDLQQTIVHIFGREDNVNEAYKFLEEYLEQLNESHNIEIEIDSLLLPYIIARCSTNSLHEEIKQKFGASIRVNIRTSKNKRSNYVVLQGRKGQLYGAKLLVESILDNVSKDIIVYDVDIPIAYHHLLVGKKGAIKDEIIENSCVDRIIFPNNNTNNNNNDDSASSTLHNSSNIITVVGSLKACKLAEIIMMEKCNMDVELDQIDIQLSKLLIEKLRIGGGIILRRIIAKCNNNSIVVDDSMKSNCVNVYLPSGELQPLNNKVRIHGYKEYTRIVADKLVRYSRENSLIVEYFDVDENMIKSIIGKGGVQLKKFSKDTSVEIIIPNTKSKKSTNENIIIYLLGSNQLDVTKLKNQIIKFVKDLKDIIEMNLDIPTKYFKKLLVKRNNQESYITQLTSQYPTVKITIPKEDDTDKLVRMKGPSKMVSTIRTEILQLIQKWDDTIREEFTIPYDHAALLRNVEEPNFTSISRMYDVQIRSFRDGDKDTKPTSSTLVNIVVEGVSKSVQLARVKIMENGPINENFKASREYHRSLIGVKGSELKKIVDGLNVSLVFPDNDSVSDNIVVRGPKQQTKIALDRLKTSLDVLIKKKLQWEKNNHIIELTIDPKWFSKLIGRGGKHIKTLKNQLRVNISIPKTDKLETQNDSTVIHDDNATTTTTTATTGDNNMVDTENNVSGNSAENESKIILRGEKKLCLQARDRIEAMVDEWERTITTEIHIPKSLHGAIRGSRSSALNRIQKRYKVEIRFAPIDDENNDTIRISGLPENVKNASEHIIDTANELIAHAEHIDEEEDYTVPDSFDPWANFKFSSTLESKSIVNQQQANLSTNSIDVDLKEQKNNTKTSDNIDQSLPTDVTTTTTTDDSILDESVDTTNLKDSIAVDNLIDFNGKTDTTATNTNNNVLNDSVDVTSTMETLVDSSQTTQDHPLNSDNGGIIE